MTHASSKDGGIIVLYQSCPIEHLHILRLLLHGNLGRLCKQVPKQSGYTCTIWNHDTCKLHQVQLPVSKHASLIVIGIVLSMVMQCCSVVYSR